MNRKERRAAKKTAGAPRESRPGSELLARALQAHQAGHPRDAESLYRQFLVIEPDHADATHLLGLIAHQLGRHEAAIELIARAVALNDKAPHFHINLGAALSAAGRRDEAAASLRRALALNPDAAEAHNNLANTLEELGQIDEAVASYRRAVALRPSDAGMLYNLAAALLAGGDASEALAIARRALRIAETAEIKALAGRCIGALRVSQGDADLRALVARALSEGWARPQALSVAATLLVKGSEHLTTSGGDPLAAFARDALFLSFLENVAVADLELERRLTRARSALLKRAASPTADSALDPAILSFCCALARQCFINEYVYDCDAEELGGAEALRDAVAQALDERRPVSPLRIAAIAAYFPLASVPGAERLLRQAWPDPVTALLVQQLREPEQERVLVETIPRVTAIADQVSQSVQQQYEENPYPRWVKAMSASVPTTVAAFLTQRFPNVKLTAPLRSDRVEILIAGCGTGQHSIETAQLFPGARILAVDLSRASLAYAKRQSLARGLAGIDYAQADILELAGIGRSFDVIEASGVLHHLADPMQGWRVLASLLRPGGVMWLGLYSALARQDIVAARSFIAEHGFDASASGIRRAREALVAAGEDAPFAPVTKVADFFTISACRDLLFHVEEHRLTLPEIAAFLASNRLAFLGFDLDPAVAARYRARFPADCDLVDLASWHRFETENPATFRSMYQFWIQMQG